LRETSSVIDWFSIRFNENSEVAYFLGHPVYTLYRIRAVTGFNWVTQRISQHERHRVIVIGNLLWQTWC